MAIILSANLSKYLFISLTIFLLKNTRYITHINLNRRKITLDLLISHCVLISRTNKSLSQRCKLFRRHCKEPLISRPHTGDMKQATSCGPTNISAALHNFLAHDVCTPDLSYNNTSTPVCICYLPPTCKIMSVIIGSSLKLYCIIQFSLYLTENTVPIIYKVRALNLFRRIIGI